MLRTDGVDIKGSPVGETGNTVGWNQAGEWLEYTVSVATSGSYDVTARVAAPAAGGTLHVEVDGTRLGASAAMPATGSWDTQGAMTVTSAASLAAGTHVLRVAFDTNGTSLGGFVGDLNYLDVVAAVSTRIPDADQARGQQILHALGRHLAKLLGARRAGFENGNQVSGPAQELCPGQ